MNNLSDWPSSQQPEKVCQLSFLGRLQDGGISLAAPSHPTSDYNVFYTGKVDDPRSYCPSEYLLCTSTAGVIPTQCRRIN